MTSRDIILNKIRENRPKEPVEMPENIRFKPYFDDNCMKFQDTLSSIGGMVIEAPNYEFIEHIFWKTYDPPPNTICLVDGLDLGTIDISKIKDPHDLAKIDVAILRGQFGVAENGSIWLDETNFGGHRALPFITQHLIIILNKNEIVANMHEAYNRLDITKSGFGLFLAGPSKTADIEQSLVIGAHGARSLTVFLIDEK